jgi:hypothetical protein
MDTVFDVAIKSHWWQSVPVISYGIDEFLINTIPIQNKTNLRIAYPFLNGQHKFWISYNNKNYNECILEKNLDMSIEIESVTIEGITVDRFKWAGEYKPNYPVDYPHKQPVIKSATYLGWNGRWELPFTTPIFTWIHQLENLGWLYEP